MNDKFSVIDSFREEAKQRQLPLTLSMGFSYGDGNHDEIGKVALLNWNLAEVRGGDQVVVKENDETKNQFILVVGLLPQLNVHGLVLVL